MPVILPFLPAIIGLAGAGVSAGLAATSGAGAPPPIPTAAQNAATTTAAGEAAAQAARLKAANAGRAATILTSPSGVLSSSGTTQKTLLGQ